MINDFLKYIDCFGTKFNFYIDKDRKFYTPLGGIFSTLAFLFGLVVFLFLNFEDFLHTAPIYSHSIIEENYNNIKFGEEKIWIPWRIRDYNNKGINHTHLFYPIIYYYKGIKNESSQGMELTYDLINYKLCNETSMVNMSELYLLNVSLGSLYCIEMEELFMGGNWQANFINYVEFDLYICKNGIDYDESNSNCSSYETIIKSASNDNSYEMEFFYPVVYYQPYNKTTPIIVKYTSYFYHFSRYSNKIDRLYLQKYVLNDDKGWFQKDIKKYTYWGFSSLSGDSYSHGEKRDLMNEGSTSRLYSFNIYLSSDIITYNRTYKKMFIIIADRLPLVNIVYILFSLIAKVLKISSGNKKLTELLFENLKEKTNKSIKSNKVNNEQFNIIKIKSKNNFQQQSIKKYDSIQHNLSNKNIPHLNGIDHTNSNLKKMLSNINKNNNNANDVSSSFVKLSPQNFNRRRHSMSSSRNFKFKFNKKAKKNQNNLSNIISDNSLNNNFINYIPVDVNNNNININIHNNLKNIEIYDNTKSIDTPKHQSSKINFKKKLNEEKSLINNNDKLTKTKKHYIKSKLFPYKYYLCSIFIKNFDVNKESIFFPKKFITVYYFICQLFDISSYLILQREFQIIKNTLLRGKYKALIENRQKINVNDHSFNIDMKECLDYQKFSILGRVKNAQNIDKKV